jgi:single-strand DNA-binding protein
MAFTINRVTLVGGNITRDAELRYATKTGNAFVSFSIAMNRGVKNQSGGWDNVAEYYDVVFWGEKSEALAPRLLKGQKVGIDGRLTQERWEDKEGKIRGAVKIIANTVILMASMKKDEGDEAHSPPPQYQQPARPPQSVEQTFDGINDINTEPLNDDDMPF